MPVDQAVQVETDLGFRPIPGTAPWHKSEKRPFEEVPDFPYNYKVVDRG